MEKIIKNIQIILNRNPQKSKVLVDGKLLPTKRVTIDQSVNNGLTEAKLELFPNKVIFLTDSMTEESGLKRFIKRIFK